MAVDRIENMDFKDDPTLTNDGGGTTSNGSDVGINASQNTTLTNLFVFNISSNESTFTTLLDGEIFNNKVIRITRDSLSKSSKRIEVKKNGYSNNEYYIIEMVDDGSPIIINPNIEQPLGISTKDVVLTKYTKTPNKVVGTPTSIANTVSSNLSFTFNKLRGGDEYEEPKKYTISFNIIGSGTPVSILKNSNKNAEFFPNVGLTEYEDSDGTKYVIRSSNTSLNRITKISWDNEELSPANTNESLELAITLKNNYSFQIETEEVFQGTPSADPKIELINTDARRYNINSKVGVPLMFRKNNDVQAITVIVGDDVLEFDDLDSGNLCGITIPHSVFKNIAKYNIKIFPFSFNDYENQVRPAEPADIIQTKAIVRDKVIKEKVIKEKVVKETPTKEDIYNPYVPTSGGGGGGRPAFLDSGFDFFDPTNPFSNGGDFIERPNRNEVIK